MPRHPGHSARPRERGATTRLQERRRRVAHEAARLLAQEGSHDYARARLKAARRLGILDDASQPRPQDIDLALREYRRLFQPDAAPQLQQRREAAAEALRFFEGFAPRLAGPVLEGTADARTPVTVHLHCDDPEQVARHLVHAGIPAEPAGRRLRVERERSAEFPAWLFAAGEVPFELLVLPLAMLHHAPLSPLDGRPMRRASLRQLGQLLAGGDDADGPDRTG